MMRLQKHGLLVAALASVAFLACVKGEQTSRSADSTARNLTLAPIESTAAMKDVPAAATEPAKAATEKATPVKKPVPPKPAAPAPLTLAVGARVPLAASDTITPRTAKAGGALSAPGSDAGEDP